MAGAWVSGPLVLCELSTTVAAGASADVRLWPLASEAPNGIAEIPKNSVLQVEAWAEAYDTTTGDAAVYRVRCASKRGTGNAASLIDNLAEWNQENDATWGFSVYVNSNQIHILAQGDGANITKWHIRATGQLFMVNG